MDFFDELKIKYLDGRAKSQMNSGKVRGALAKYLQIIELKLKLKHGGIAPYYNLVAECYQKLDYVLESKKEKNRIKAIEYYAKAGEKFFGSKEYFNSGMSYEAASKCYADLEEFDKAAEYRLKSADIYALSGNNFSTSVSYLHAAEYYLESYNLEKAAAAYMKSAESNMKVEDYSHASSSYRSAAKCFERLKNYQDAIDAYSRAIELDYKVRDYHAVADTYDEIAKCYWELSDFEGAVHYYLKASEMNFRENRVQNTANDYKSIGSCYRQIKNYGKAIEYYHKSIEFNAKTNNNAENVQLYTSVAECYIELGDLDKAAEAYVFSSNSSLADQDRNGAFNTLDKAIELYIKMAESRLSAQEYKASGDYYKKAARYSRDAEDYQKSAELYLKYSEIRMREGKFEKAVFGYVEAAERYIEAKLLDLAGEAYLMAHDYAKALECFLKYVDMRIAENDLIHAADGYKYAARCCKELDKPFETRDYYNKALWHYNTYLLREKRQKAEHMSEKDTQVLGYVSKGMAECHYGLGDLINAQKHFKSAVEYFLKINAQDYVNVCNALLFDVEAELLMERGEYPNAGDMLHNSMSLFEASLKGEWNYGFRLFLEQGRAHVKFLLNKIEFKPEVDITVDKQSYTFTDTILLLNVLIVNNGKYSTQKMMFLTHLPDEIKLQKLPDVIPEIKPGESKRVSIELTSNKVGSYRFRLLEVMYRDNEGIQYVKASNEVLIEVDERPMTDFKNYTKAVGIFLKYAKTQFENGNFFYAGNGYKDTAESYGKFNTDVHLKEYYTKAIECYIKYAKSQPVDEKDPIKIRVIGDAYRNVAECYHVTGDLVNAEKYVYEALGYYQRIDAGEYITVANALYCRTGGEIAIGHGDYSKAGALLNEALYSFDKAIKDGGWDLKYVTFLEKNENEVKMLLSQVKLKPEAILNMEKPPLAYENVPFTLNLRITNPGDKSIRNLRCIPNVPEGLTLMSIPPTLPEVGPGESKSITFEMMSKTAGVFKFKPLDLAYTDDEGVNYTKGSHEISLKVEPKSKPSETEKGEAKPDTSLILNEIPTSMLLEKPQLVEGSVSNKCPDSVYGVRFTGNSTPEFVFNKVPEQVEELKPGESKTIQIEITPKLLGKFKFKPLEMLYRDRHGNKFFKSSNELAFNVEPEKRKITDEAESELARIMVQGITYVVKEPEPEKSINVFLSQTRHGHRGLYVTRNNPEQVKQDYGLTDADAKLIWLTDIGVGKGMVQPSSLEELSSEIGAFARENKNAIVFLDGLEYLINYNGFNLVIRFIQHIRDIISLNKANMIIPVNVNALDKQQLTLLERECRILTPPS